MKRECIVFGWEGRPAARRRAARRRAARLRLAAGVVALLGGASLGACASRPKPPQPGAPAAGAGGRGIGDRDVSNENATRVEELFSGRFPGVQVFPAGGGVKIRMRSGTLGGGEPLLVLDGQILGQGNGGVIDVSPNDIARIEVVRSAADLAMYGSRGGNGVVRITTKRAAR